MNAPDRAPAQWVELPGDAHGSLGAPAPVSLGLLELWLPLAARRWWLLSAMVLGAVLGFGASMLQPVHFNAVASFVVQPVMRPSQGVAPGGLPALAGLLGAGGTSPVDLHVTVLRSQTMADRITDRFDLQQTWGARSRIEAQQHLARRVSFGTGRRDGMVQISMLDASPQLAAAIANQYVVELRSMLRGFALEEARERRLFYDAQMVRARQALATAQRGLQQSGFDRAALRTQPSAAADRFARLSADVAATELRLTATRRVRSDASPEVKQVLTELAALQQQLAGLRLPRDDDEGAYVGRLREFRYAEALVESIGRQVEAARVDEAADAVPFQVLDQARPPEWPNLPRPLLWAAAGAAGVAGLAAAGILARHRRALARLDPAWQQRLAQVQSVLPGRP